MQAPHRHIQSMGTRLDLVFPGVDDLVCEEITKMIVVELTRIEAKLSIHRYDSELSVINSMAHAGPVELDNELVSIFNDIEDYHKETHGYFDVTMKPVFDFYQEKENDGNALTDNLRNQVGMDKLKIEGSAITLLKKGMQIDMGGFGKGYAMKRILLIMESAGIDCALISFGESLVYGLGTHPYGDTWKVSIPIEGTNRSVEYDLHNHAISTSGNTLNNQKKFRNSGHIVNPVTMQMRSGQGLISVKSADPLRAEVFSTALFSAGEKESFDILKGICDLEANWLLPGNNMFE